MKQVKITSNKGKLSLEIPEGMTGKQLAQWKAKNREALKQAKDLEPIESKSETPPSNPQVIKIYVFSGKITLELPQGMMGYQLVHWRANNKPILESARQSADGLYAALNY